MRQLVGIADGADGPTTVRELLVSLAPPAVRASAAAARRRRARVGRRPDALRRRARRLGRPRRLRRRAALGRVPHPRRRTRPRRGRRPPAAHVLGRRAEADGARGPAARRRRRPAARRARQLPRRPGQALAGGRAAGVAQDDPVRQPRPRAARDGGDAHRHRRGQRHLDPRRRVRRLPRGPRGPPREAHPGPVVVRRRAPAPRRRSSPRCAGGRRSPTSSPRS